MRILHTINTLWPEHGGPSHCVPELCTALVDRGHKLSIMTLAGSQSDAANKSQAHGVVIDSFPWFGLQFSPDFARSISARCAEADVIHGNGLWRHVNWSTGRAVRRLGKPLVITPHGLLEPAALAHARLSKRVSALLFDNSKLRAARCIHVASNKEYESVRAYGLKNPVAIIPYGIDVSVFENAVASESATTRRPEREGKRIMLFLSRISWEKGVLELVQAWARLESSFPEWHLMIVGEGNAAYVNEVRQAIQSTGLANRITWTGPLYGVAKAIALKRASLFILPTHSESFGMAILEALAAGVPVITTHGAPWEVLLAKKCGWWIPRGLDRLQGAMDEAMRLPPETLRAMGVRAQEEALTQFSWQRLAQLMEAVYRWVLEGGQAPECVRLR